MDDSPNEGMNNHSSIDDSPNEGMNNHSSKDGDNNHTMAFPYFKENTNKIIDI